MCVLCWKRVGPSAIVSDAAVMEKITESKYKDTGLTSMLTGSIVLMWTFGAEEDRSRWPNWFRWSSSLDRKLGGMGMDLDGETVEWQIDLQSNIRRMQIWDCGHIS